jgi:hypothetical protein
MTRHLAREVGQGEEGNYSMDDRKRLFSKRLSDFSLEKAQNWRFSA